ncbi:hypothetical protein BU24DRAFT_345128 [Aaosphaeria arxii CBS 175.79]|uniref:Cnl2/NKP2 family protein n=1 Tax=Aaosphaeria arxii CBS 175.79 TaxID=1450172 RepID=A0A6A5XUN3_9PLEO|nr:uncharacterized protein BU24DRAFT_345128 [Aaosphaeria arxii CBS 175.79]KAF2017018.1 hypothetical protein BU24DRAFT_345128 [Aaosphaeria arxii CBS 175.79]
MPPNETSILSDFLLSSASIREVLSLKEFTEIFPKSYRTNPAIKELYEELHRTRQQDIEAVRQNVSTEVKRSKRLRQEMVEQRRQDDRAAVAGLDPVALDVEMELSGTPGRKEAHTLQTIHPGIEEACEDIELQIAEMEGDIQKALSEVQEAVGELSDLRYGRFSQTATGEDISDEVLAALKRLEASCTDTTG